MKYTTKIFKITKKDETFKNDSITIKIKILTKNGPEYRKLDVAEVIDGLYEAAVLYELPPDTGYDYDVVYTTSASGISIQGVMGLAEKVETVKENWKNIVLQPAVPYPYELPETGTIIEIKQI